MYSLRIFRTILAFSLFLININLFAQDIYQTTADVNLRSGPGIKYKSLYAIKKGETINVIEKHNLQWFKIDYNGRTGFLSSKFIIPFVESSKTEDLPKIENQKQNSTSLLTYVIIGLVVIVLILLISNLSKRKRNTKVHLTESNNLEKKLKRGFIDNIHKNIKIEVNSIDSNNSENDDSIIDVTGKAYNIINPQLNLVKYTEGVPYWKHQYVYSSSEINYATSEQVKFYNNFKHRFINGEFLDVEGNSNYYFILLFDLIEDYENHNNLLLIEKQLEELGQCYPKTKPYLYSSLINKLEQIGDTNTIEKIKSKHDSISSYQYRNSYSQFYFEGNYWGLGTKYQTELKLTDEEVEILNTISFYSNNFFDIKSCSKEIIKLFLKLLKASDTLFNNEGTNLTESISSITEHSVKKELSYKSNTEFYKYRIEWTKRIIYTSILKHCENSVREKYNHKRKLNSDIEILDPESKSEFQNQIISKVSSLLPILSSSIELPDKDTEIELYSQNTSRWKSKFEELTANYKNNPKEFIDSIVSLGKLNKKNPSIENIFFEASKFISKYDKESALSLYVHYLYHDLKSVTFDNKQLTKTIQKNLFKTNEQLHDFEIIVSELIKDKDLEKALKNVSKVYEVKRKKIQLDTDSIKEVQQQHSGTVELLNEYLMDDFEDENNVIKSQEISNEEIKIEITPKSEEGHYSAFVSELTFSEIHTTALELFAKSNFSLPQSELETFAKSKGIFKNQLVESINDTCYEVLDDVLIEEEDDYYTINTTYFQIITAK